MNLAETWGFLEGDVSTTGRSGRVQRRILPGGRRNVFLALETRPETPILPKSSFS